MVHLKDMHILHHTFSITLSLALRLRGFSLSSDSDGVTGLFVRILASLPPTICLIHASFSLYESNFSEWFNCLAPSSERFMMSRNACFTILSSKLWNDMTASLPPGPRESKQELMESFNVLSSSFTAILNAWNTRVAVLIHPCLPPPSVMENSCQVECRRFYQRSKFISLKGLPRYTGKYRAQINRMETQKDAPFAEELEFRMRSTNWRVVCNPPVDRALTILLWRVNQLLSSP